MGFEREYAIWMNRHLEARTGERLRRLREGHGYGEKLFLENGWYPAIGSFDDLHPEYEVFDYRDGSRFLDHAFVRYPYRLDWETDAFGTHLRHIGRREYDDGLDRQNHLVNDGWKVFRLSVDMLRDQPRKCQQFIQQVMGKLYGLGAAARPPLPLKQREIMRFAARRREALTVRDVMRLLDVSDKHARKLLHELVTMGMLAPASGQIRVHAYQLGPKARDAFD